MTALDLLNKIPEERRRLLYISNRSEKEIYTPSCTYDSYYLGDSEKEKIINLQLPVSDLKQMKDDNDEVDSNEESNFFVDEKEADEFFEDAAKSISQTRKIDSLQRYEFDDHVIYIKLPVIESDDDLSDLVGDEYFLTTKYKQTFPEVRYKYLKWLQDISITPEAQGFLWNYLQCLERSALEGKFEESCEEINLLIESNHKNEAFVRAAYRSLQALALKQEEYVLILNLYEQTKVEISHIVLLAFFKEKIGLSPRVLAEVFKKLQLKLGAVKGYESTFEKCISDILFSKYGSREILISDYTTLDDCPTSAQKLNNYNLSIEIGHIQVYEIWYDEKLNRMLREIHNESYEKLKEVKKDIRKSASNK